MNEYESIDDLIRAADRMRTLHRMRRAHLAQCEYNLRPWWRKGLEDWPDWARWIRRRL